MKKKLFLKKKNELRLKYVKEVSFKTDVALFFSTIMQVVKKAVKVIVKMFRGESNGIHNS